MRAIACILVVLLHIGANSLENLNQKFLGDFFKFGGSGVDIFFVLSGFIICYSNTNNLTNSSATGTFLKRRFIRVFPIYWIIISMFLFLQLALPMFYKTPYTPNIINLAGTYLLLPEHVMLNGVSWSLTNELLFYLFFALALSLPNLKYIIFLVITWFLAILTAGLFLPAASQSNAFVAILLFPMNIEFLLGVSVVFIVKRVPSSWSFSMLGIGVLFFGLGALASNANISLVGQALDQGLERVILFGIPSFLIVLAIVKIETTRTVKIHQVFLELGDASYSIYLVHLPLVAAYYKVIAKLEIANTLLLLFAGLAILALICVIGIFMYHKIEKPLIKRLNKQFIKKFGATNKLCNQ